MIKLEELRIGNWILPNSKEKFNEEYNLIPTRLDEDIMAYGLILGTDSNKYDYIELTPKILERFGFEKSSYGRVSSVGGIVNRFFIDCFITINNITIHVVFEKESICDIIISKHSKSFDIPKLSFVHQLQNLFFALTGIELNDIVAYNYYLEISKGYANCFKSSFEEFILKDKNIIPFSNYREYHFGDLPKNLFL